MSSTCRCRLPPRDREVGRHAGEATDGLEPNRRQEWDQLTVAYLLVVEGSTGRPWFTGDEVAAVEMFREADELGSMGVD